MGKEKRGNIEYSGQVVDISRTGQRISVKDILAAVQDQEDVPFLNVFSLKSIYYISIFNFGQKQSVGANIPIKDLPEIREHTKLATKEIFKQVNNLSAQNIQQEIRSGAVSEAEAVTGSVPGPDSPAFRKLRMGKNLAGKSPAELLQGSADPGKTKNSLMAQANYLNQNLAQYPNNRLDIEAIQAAITLFDQGKLAVSDGTASGGLPAQSMPGNGVNVLRIYNPPDKYFKRMIDRETGKTKCYQVSVNCYPAKEYPYRVRIKNYYAKIGAKENGMTPILGATAEKLVDYYMDLTEGEWLYILEQLDTNLQACRNLWYNYARKNDYERRQIQDQWKKQS